MKDFSYENIEAATKGFSFEQLIGKGSHGSVYKGKLKGGKLVAVKKPLEGVRTLGDDPKLSNEIDILSSIKNSSVVNLIGVCHGPSGKFLIMDFMPNGSLHDLLHLLPDPPSWPRRAVMAIQIARAILSLHEAKPPIIHRDIKSANILIDRNWNARLADFSLAVRDDSSQSPVSTVPAGTIGYLDPCYTESGQLGPKSDVFSFGVVLLELISSRKVMDMDGDPSSIIAWAVPMIGSRRVAEVCDRRVALPDGMLRPIDRMLSIAVRCVSENVERRPLMGEVVGELQRVVEGIWWPIWGPVRRKITDRVRRCVRAWRRCVKKRVTTTKIACKDHLIDGGNHDCSDDGVSPSRKA
ncbi:serine/threonine-protein kinase-like protein At5g23170 [Phoenix dactylifera]|uniref:non-specific serine/threonine protein kinase n=1 Tax=Phoenix dactylifera TaxID=42345 RepID=A0A8B7D4M0_PHODC|nr:serine/threonine-protein kinase-like protein At5g23170 [Phoenix dactylifera]